MAVKALISSALSRSLGEFFREPGSAPSPEFEPMTWGSESDRAVNSTGVLTREKESFSAKSRAPRRTFKVAFLPREISPKTERAGGQASLPQILATKAENAKRREEILSAFSGNFWAAFARGKPGSSPRGTLFVTTSLFAKAVNCCGGESWQFRVPLGGFQVGTGSNSWVRLLSHRRWLPTERAAVRRGCCRYAEASPERSAKGQPRAAVAHPGDPGDGPTYDGQRF
jgi:hypothetical protein